MRFAWLLLLCLFVPSAARAQTPVIVQCYNASNPINPWQPASTGCPLPVTASPNSAVQTVACTTLCANQILKTSAGSIYSFNVSADATLSAAAWWIMIYNTPSAPADGAVTPSKCYAMASGVTSFSAAFSGAVPLGGTGITIGVSTNGCFTKAASTHAFISGDYQ